MEAETLKNLQRAVDASYVKAVRLMAACRGKIVVTGTGKSGLIAQKIAATLASTGSAAHYIHPNDGLHGDIGAIKRGDVVLTIGKSGESAELNDLLPAVKRLKCALIALTSNRRSTLAKSADVVVYIPVKQEACLLDLVPTNSTTAALAVGDALAVTLMELKGFDAKHFARLHPGGQLGRRLTLLVSDVMHSGKDHPVVRENATPARMLKELTQKHLGAVNVVDKRGRFVGLITDYDLRSILERDVSLSTLSLHGIMNRKPTTIAPFALAVDAMQMMIKRKKPFAVLPVVDKKRRAVGIVHLHDIRRSGL